MNDNLKLAVPIKVEDVSSVYSGRPGCMCGCMGKYSYASAHREWAGENRGYEVRDDSISDRSVKMMVNKFNRIFENDPGAIEVLDEGRILFFETETRYYAIYMRNNAQVIDTTPKPSRYNLLDE